MRQTLWTTWQICSSSRMISRYSAKLFSQISMIDDGVGRVMKALDGKGIADDTIIIYTADHGFSLGHHGVWGHGEDRPSNCYEVSYHIPLNNVASRQHRGWTIQ